MNTHNLLNTNTYHSPFGSTFDIPRDVNDPTSEGYRYGFNGQEKDDEVSGNGNSYTAEFWQYSPRLGRRWNIDPVVKEWESPYAAFAGNPIWFVDPMGSDTAMFGEDNKFITINPGGENIGQKIGKNGFLFAFADPGNDIKEIIAKKENGIISELYIPTDEEILKDLDRAGVNKDKNRGLVDGPLFLKDHSNEGKNDGAVDFTMTSQIHSKEGIKGLSEKYFYVTKISMTNSKNIYVAHNKYNFGNFMWGASAKAVGVSLPLALMGAHVNNYFFDTDNIGKDLDKRSFDSRDDQFSITLGWSWRLLE